MSTTLTTAVAEDTQSEAEVASDRVFTLPNIISFIRLLMVPVYLGLLVNDHRVAALTVFSIAAATDFLDGQIARRTHSVSKLGKLLDPAIDTILMFTGVLGVVAIGELPAWFAVIILLREAFLLIAGGVLLRKCGISIPVVYPGKVATTFLFTGFAGMMLGMPAITGLELCNISWLPGFNAEATTAWIWLIYLGLTLQIGVTVYYCVVAAGKLSAYLSNRE